MPRKGIITSRSSDNSLVHRDIIGSPAAGTPHLPEGSTMNFLWLLSCCALLGTAFGKYLGRQRPERLSPLPPTVGRGAGSSNPQISKGQRGPCSQFSHALLVLA